MKARRRRKRKRPQRHSLLRLARSCDLNDRPRPSHRRAGLFSGSIVDCRPAAHFWDLFRSHCSKTVAHPQCHQSRTCRPPQLAHLLWRSELTAFLGAKRGGKPSYGYCCPNLRRLLQVSNPRAWRASPRKRRQRRRASNADSRSADSPGYRNVTAKSDRKARSFRKLSHPGSTPRTCSRRATKS